MAVSGSRPATTSSKCGHSSPKRTNRFWIGSKLNSQECSGSRRRFRALSLSTVLVDQSLKARVFAQRVPSGIEFEKRNGEAVWRCEQMIEQAKGLIVVTGPNVNLRERGGDRWSAESVFGFR